MSHKIFNNYVCFYFQAPNNRIIYSLFNATQEIDEYFGVNPSTGDVYCKLWQVYYAMKNVTSFTVSVLYLIVLLNYRYEFINQGQNYSWQK